MRYCVAVVLALCLFAVPSRVGAQLPPGPDPVVDVLVLYTAQARADMESQGGPLATRVDEAFASLNTVLANSGARARFTALRLERRRG